MGSHASGCPSSFLHKYWGLRGVRGGGKRGPGFATQNGFTQILLKLYSKIWIEWCISGLSNFICSLDDVQDRLF